MLDMPKEKYIGYNNDINSFFLVNKNCNCFQYFVGRHGGVVLIRLK